MIGVSSQYVQLTVFKKWFVMNASRSKTSHDVTGTVWLHPNRMKKEYPSRISNNFNSFKYFQQEFAVSAVKVYDVVVRTSIQPCDMHCIPHLVSK